MNIFFLLHFVLTQEFFFFFKCGKKITVKMCLPEFFPLHVSHIFSLFFYLFIFCSVSHLNLSFL